MHLPDGLYDKFVTQSVAQFLAGLGDPSCRTVIPLAAEEAAERLADALAKQLTSLLDELGGDEMMNRFERSGINKLMGISSTVDQIKKGGRIVYNDGRPGHIGVFATVIEVDQKGMTVQFEDRANTSYIAFSDRGWMDFIVLAN